MRRINLVMGGIFLACALTGCGKTMPELTEEQNAIITEYAVDLLLKYDSNYNNRLIDLEDYYAEQELIQARIEAQRAADAAKEEAAAQAASEAEASGTGAADNTAEVPTVSSIEEFYGIDGIVFRYTGYDLTYTYPETVTDGTSAFFSMDATPGMKLLVLKFLVTNISGGQKELNMLNYGMRTRISAGDEISSNVLSTMLLNDLQAFNGMLEADESTELVAVIEVPENASIGSIAMTLRGDAGNATITLQ